MKVAFLNRGRDAFPGGDLIALDATMDALRKRGIECVETGWDREALRSGGFDLAQIFHCNFSWSYGNYEAVRDVGLPYVLTPVYYPGPLLSDLTREQLLEIMVCAKRVLPFSRKEAFGMYSEIGGFDFDGFMSRHTVIPNGTDPMFHGEPRYLAKIHPTKIIAVSAREGDGKGISLIQRIADRLNVALTVATDMSREELARAYRCHGIFVNASPSERMSLTIGEALCAGCRVLATDRNEGNSWYEGLVTFDPRDEFKLEHLIRWAITSDQWDYRPNAAARCLTWDWVAEKIERVYREVVG